MQDAQQFTPIRSIVLLGAGNVGFHLAEVLVRSGAQLKQVFSRQLGKAKLSAARFDAVAIDRLEQVLPQQDLYILAVHDQAIAEVAKGLGSIIGEKALVVHTSGASPVQILQPYFNRIGVFYPLQSFSRDQAVDWATVPMCIYANREEDQNALAALAQKFSQQVALVNDEQRAQLHLAAVFVNNFTNLCYQIGRDIVEAKGMSFDILLPLIQQTVDKVKAQPTDQKNPFAVQTGPAVRNDIVTIERHLQRLEEQFPAYRPLYEQLTLAIQALKS